VIYIIFSLLTRKACEDLLGNQKEKKRELKKKKKKEKPKLTLSTLVGVNTKKEKIVKR
jgi:hypothetical protein